MLKQLLYAAVFSSSIACSNGLASTIQTTFTGVNGANDFGYYVGAYYGQLGSQNVTLYCDDFANDVNVGQTWNSNLSSITAGSNLSNTRYGDVSNSLQLYQEIAWLDTQFGQTPSAQWGDIHATIWQIFDPGNAPTPSSSYWLSQAKSNYKSLDYSNFRVVTNEGPVLKTGQIQEFITVLSPSSPYYASTAGPSPTATPEPGTVSMMIGGVLFAALAVRQMKKKSSENDKMGLAPHVP